MKVRPLMPVEYSMRGLLLQVPHFDAKSEIAEYAKEQLGGK